MSLMSHLIPVKISSLVTKDGHDLVFLKALISILALLKLDLLHYVKRCRNQFPSIKNTK